ncbi:MAG: hypothetical protein HY718_08275 [Planctomycetes bacterium]|nr:hypothetical protein [Planctomycetota bacterium]
MTRSWLWTVIVHVLLAVPDAVAVDWVRGGTDGRQPVWGIRGGVQFAIPPASYGPRGLVRILYPTLPNGKYDLINFIAVEPIVRGRRAFSELEPSRLDATAGKRMWVDASEVRGKLSRASDAIEQLQVVIHVEPFDNGAHVRLIVEQRSDRPDEIALTVTPEPDSSPMEYCILTATMGNRARTRLFWLKDEVVSSLTLYPDYRGTDFAPHAVYPLPRLTVTEAGDLVVAITTDEHHPADTRPFPGTDRWYYGGFPVTQFWKMAGRTWRDDVHVAVNARYTYWRNDRPIPGGIAFENFELRERFRPGQQFIFGVSRSTPAELGLRPTASQPQTAPP